MQLNNQKVFKEGTETILIFKIHKNSEINNCIIIYALHDFQKLDDNKRAEYDKKSCCSFVNSRIGHLNLMFPRFLLFVLNLNKDT